MSRRLKRSFANAFRTRGGAGSHAILPAAGPVHAGLLTLAALAVVAITLLLIITRIAPEVYWDIDPFVQPMTPIVRLSPTRLAWINCGAVLAGAFAVGVSIAAGARPRWTAFVGGGIAILVCLGHMPTHFDNLLRFGHWIAGIALALGSLHLAAHDAPRRLMVAAMLGILPYMAISSCFYVWLEHPAMIESFRLDEAANLERHNLEPGSPQHVLFVRRLEGNDAVGAFGLANVFASVVLTLTLLALGIAVASWRSQRIGVIDRVVLAAVVLMGVLTLVLTQSKGAMIAMVVACGFLGAVLLSRRSPRLRGLLPVLALAAVACALLAVFARASLGPPESIEQERSLLFRYHYFQGAARAWMRADPVEQTFGLGAAGFRTAYPQVKNPINPEDVTSTHNVFVDYLVMLGVGGLMLSALLVRWLCRCARQIALVSGGDVETFAKEMDEQPKAGADVRDDAMLIALATASLVFGAYASVTMAELLNPERMLPAFFGFAGMVVVLTLLRRRAILSSWFVSVGLLLAAVGLLVHCQIEMAFFQDGSAVFALVVMGMAGGVTPGVAPRAVPAAAEQQGDAPGRPQGWDVAARYMPTAVLVVLSAWLVATYAIPLTREQAALAAAARAAGKPDVVEAVEELDRAAGIMPADPAPRSDVVRTYARIAYSQPDASIARQYTLLALERIDESLADSLDVSSMLLTRAQLHAYLVTRFNDESYVEQALADWHAALELRPYDVQAHLQFGQFLWEIGREAQAAEQYRKMLKLNDLNYLDPARQLSPTQLEQVRSRAGEAGQGG